VSIPQSQRELKNAFGKIIYVELEIVMIYQSHSHHMSNVMRLSLPVHTKDQVVQLLRIAVLSLLQPYVIRLRIY